MAVEITELISNYGLHTPQVESCALFYNRYLVSKKFNLSDRNDINPSVVRILQ